ncbi:MAG: nucleotidyltransferase domain-containing protein [Chitinivibrionia bacterium]|nr:nucleotidyltransferase domain-containing protein [Chitinivibrionia bacterium]
MNDKINLDEKSFSIVCDILKKNLKGMNAKTYIYGSRAKGKNRKYSDIDIAVKAENNIPFSIMAHLSYDFEESFLDYFVDVIDLNATSENFIKHIEKDLVEFSY